MLASTLIFIAAYTHLVHSQASPCPETLSYEARDPNEPDRWYGVIMLTTEDDLEGIWLKIILDTRADLLGNWFGETSSMDNKEFHIRNPKYKLEAGPPVSVRFFVKYNENGQIPSIKRILLNGKTICSIVQESRPTPPMLHISRPSDRDILELDVLGSPSNNPNRNPDKDRFNVPNRRGEDDNDRFSDNRDQMSTYGNRPNRNEYDRSGYQNSGTTTRPEYNDHQYQGNHVSPEYIDNDRHRRPVDNERNPRPGDNGRNPRPVDNDRNPKPVDNERNSEPADNERHRRPAEHDGRPVGPDNGFSNNNNDNNRQTGRPFVGPSSTTTRKSTNTGYTTKSPGRRSTTTAIPDLSNIRDEHGRPIFETNSQQHQKPASNNNYDVNDTSKHRASTARPDHHDKNQLSIGTNNNNNNDDDFSEHEFFPGDYVNLINRPSTRPQSVVTRVKPECGTVAQRANALISHGQNTTPGQWPWHAAIYHSKGIQLVYTCGGTLISENHIVTAAHCVTRPNTNQKVNEKFLLVYLGKYNLIAFGSEVQDRDVEEIYVHPQYNYSVYFNDIAVLKLSRIVEVSNTVRPCCLWEGNADLDEITSKHGTVVGWGFDENKQLSRNLMQAEMPVVTTVKCIYSNREFFSQFTFENNFCAGFRNGTSVCNGDSGGGMVFPKPGTSGNNAIWQLRGIVSVGVALQTQGICDTSHYIIFTDVAKYLTWIKKIMNTNDT